MAHSLSKLSLICILLIAIGTLAQSPTVGNFITPQAGTMLSKTNNKIAVETPLALDSMVIFMQYLSDNGITRKKTIATLYSAPYLTTINPRNYPELYGNGGSIYAELYRKDDTLSIIHEEHIYITHSQEVADLFLAQNQPIPLISLDSTLTTTLTISQKSDDILLTLMIKTSSVQQAKELKNDLSCLVVVDPILSESPYPTTTTSILTITPNKNENSYLISHKVEKTSNSFTLKQMQSTISIPTTLVQERKALTLTLSLPNYLLGASVPEQWLFSIALQANSSTIATLYSGDLGYLSAPKRMAIVSLK